MDRNVHEHFESCSDSVICVKVTLNLHWNYVKNSEIMAFHKTVYV